MINLETLTESGTKIRGAYISYKIITITLSYIIITFSVMIYVAYLNRVVPDIRSL